MSLSQQITENADPCNLVLAIPVLHSGSLSGSSTIFRRVRLDSGQRVIVVLCANSKPSNAKAWRRDRGIALTSAVLAVG